MRIAVIGTGYVGLVSGTCLAETGNNVICVDNDESKLKQLQNAELPIYEPNLDIYFHRNIEKKRLTFTNDLKDAVLNSEIIMFCLPTPQGGGGEADLRFVMDVADKVGSYMKEEGDTNFKVIVNKSTVPVGTALKVREVIEKHSVKNYDMISNPEFLREGFAVDDFMKPDRIVVGGRNEKALEIMRTLYEPFVRQGNPILIMDNESAEVSKYAANSYLAMRITFMNELANFCENVGANVDVVRQAMGTDTRIGKRFLFPGIGYGGSCFPKDVNALIKTAQDTQSPMTILETVDRVNTNQKLILTKKVEKYFDNDIAGKKLAVWGLAFKPNTDDMREAPSIIIINRLLERGAKIAAYDPAAMETSKYFFGDKIEYSPNEYQALENADALLVLTEWNEFRNPQFDRIKSLMKEPVIFDGRNIFNEDKMEGLGFDYFSIGRVPVKAK